MDPVLNDIFWHFGRSLNISYILFIFKRKSKYPCVATQNHISTHLASEGWMPARFHPMWGTRSLLLTLMFLLSVLTCSTHTGSRMPLKTAQGLKQQKSSIFLVPGQPWCFVFSGLRRDRFSSLTYKEKFSLSAVP